MKLEPANIICPKCGNANYMRYLIGKGVGKLNIKCINCNSYFNFDEICKRSDNQPDRAAEGGNMKAYLKMEMPPSCYFCPMTNDGFYLCKANNSYRQLEDDCEECRPEWCPLIPIPEHGRLVVLDRETALAIAAGSRAIQTTKRFNGASYVYDPLGEDGGPYEIPYVKAGYILRNIWDEYPLDGEKAEEGMK